MGKVRIGHRRKLFGGGNLSCARTDSGRGMVGSFQESLVWLKVVHDVSALGEMCSASKEISSDDRDLIRCILPVEQCGQAMTSTPV